MEIGNSFLISQQNYIFHVRRSTFKFRPFNVILDYINALNDNLPDDLLFETNDAGGMPTSSAAISSAPTSVVGSIAGGAGGPPQVVVASTMGMNNGGSALNGITTNCVQSQPMMTSQPQRMPTMPNAPNQNINLVTALQGNPGGPQLQPGKNWQKLLKFFKRCIYKFEMFLKWAFLNLRHFQ